MECVVKRVLDGASGQVDYGFGVLRRNIWIESVVKRVLDQACGQEGSD